MEFEVALIKAKDCDFLRKNAAVNVADDYWLYEGDEWMLQEEQVSHEVIARGNVPSLGGLTQRELLLICKYRLGVEI